MLIFVLKVFGPDDSRVTEIQTRGISDGYKAVPIDDTIRSGYSYRMLERPAEQGDEDRSMSANLAPSPKYTTSDKWIMDQQKRRLQVEQNWLLKEQKTEKKIAACFEKLKVHLVIYHVVYCKFLTNLMTLNRGLAKLPVYGISGGIMSMWNSSFYRSNDT